MAKRSLLIFIITIFFISVASCNKTNSNKENNGDDTVFSLVFYPIGGVYKEIYKFVLFGNDTLRITYNGEELNSDFMSSNTYCDYKETKLSDQDVNKIMEILNDIYSEKDAPSFFTDANDAWVIKLDYKDTTFTEPFINDSTKLAQIAQFLIDKSPVNIDLYGFA